MDPYLKISLETSDTAFRSLCSLCTEDDRPINLLAQGKKEEEKQIKEKVEELVTNHEN